MAVKKFKRIHARPTCDCRMVDSRSDVKLISVLIEEVYQLTGVPERIDCDAAGRQRNSPGVVDVGVGDRLSRVGQLPRRAEGIEVVVAGGPDSARIARRWEIKFP